MARWTDVTTRLRYQTIPAMSVIASASPSGRTQWHRRGRTPVWLDPMAMLLHQPNPPGISDPRLSRLLGRVSTGSSRPWLRRARPLSTEQAGNAGRYLASRPNPHAPMMAEPRPVHGGHGVLRRRCRSRGRGWEATLGQLRLCFACAAVLPRAGHVAPFGGSPGPCDQEMEGLAG